MQTRIDSTTVDWRATRNKARAHGYPVHKLAGIIGVNYGSLTVLLCGHYKPLNPNESAFIQKVIAWMVENDLLVVHEDKEAA